MPSSWYRGVGKRFFDFCVALVGLIVLFPVFLVVGILVAISSPGPIFFKQQRVGRSFKVFTIYKFRTMQDFHLPVHPGVTARTDPRITVVGRWLRRTKLDELPQLLNVLKGDMSFVGPRPELHRYVVNYQHRYGNILSVRPGITDVATLVYRNEESILSEYEDVERAYVSIVLPRKMALYEYYIDQISFILDLRIILTTVFGVGLNGLSEQVQNR